jgi:hypothetical protein
MIRTLIAVVVISILSCVAVRAQTSDDPPMRSQKSMLKESGKFDPQRLIGLSLDTVRVFFAMIGRVTEENQNGEVHLHALSADSLAHGIRPSEADAIVGKNGTRTFTAAFYKLDPDQLKKLGAKDFSGGKVLTYNADVEWPTMVGQVEMNTNRGIFSIACRAK